MYKIRREVEAQRLANLRTDLSVEELQAEKEAIEKGVFVYSDEILKQVDALLENDDMILKQLKRRVEVYGLKPKTLEDIKHA